MSFSAHIVHELLDAFFNGPKVRFPPAPDDALGWFGVALYDALAPLHGEPKFVEAWPR